MHPRTFIELSRIDGDAVARPILVCVEQIASIQPGAGSACITLTDRTHFWTAETADEIANRLRLVGCQVATTEALTCPDQP